MEEAAPPTTSHLPPIPPPASSAPEKKHPDVEGSTGGSGGSRSKTGQCSVFSVYQVSIAGAPRHVTVAWSRSLINHSLNVSVDKSGAGESPFICKVDLKHWPFWTSKKGLKSFDLDGRRVVGVFWDFRSAKFAGGPEPLSGYYVAVVCDDEVALLIGDCKKEAYKKTKARPAAEEATLVTKRENVFGKKCFSTRARFDAGRKKEHDIVVENSISGSKEPEMWISVDGVVAIHVSNLQWKFRGNETVFVETVPLQVFWDVHDWLFKGPGYAFFIFKPGLPGEKSPTVTPTESRGDGDGDGDGDDNDDSPMSIESSRNWSCSLASEELCFFLYAWKAE